MPEHSWNLHQWAGALVWYFAYHLGGYKGVIVFRMLVFLLTTGTLLLTLNLINRNHFVLKLILLTVFAMLVRHHFFERPLIFSALFLACLQYLVIRANLSDNAKWFILLLFIVWVNVHGGFIYGILFLAAYFRSSRILLSAAAGIIAGVFLLNIVNPNGIKGILFTLNCLFEPLYHRIVAEYKTADIFSYKLFYATLLAAAILAIINRRSLKLENVLIFLGFSAIAIRTNRNILFYAIVAVPVLFELGVATIKKTLSTFPAIPRGSAKYAFMILLWAALSISVIIPDKVYWFGFGLYKPFYPTGIFDFIKKNKPVGNIFNDMPLGGPMIWFLYPDYRVFIDGRFEAYENRFWIDEYYHILNTRKGWERLLDKYNVTACLLSYGPDEKEDFLGKVLQKSRDWKMVAFDEYTVLFMKDVPQNRDIIARAERFLSGINR